MNLWITIRADSEDSIEDSDEDNDIGEEEFVGNIVLSWCLGLLILVLHLVVVSGIEAYWLQKMKVRGEKLECFGHSPLEFNAFAYVLRFEKNSFFGCENRS